VHKRSKKQFFTTLTRPHRNKTSEEHDENHCCRYTAGLNIKLGGNISQSEISNIATDCKSDDKK